MRSRLTANKLPSKQGYDPPRPLAQRSRNDMLQDNAMLRHKMKRTGLWTLALTALLLLPGAPQAQTPQWPPKTVRIVVPFAPGSTPDLVGRLLADGLQARHPGSSFIIENKAGASGNLGTEVVARAAPDGATLGISLGGPLAINTLLFASLPYNPDTDIAPVSLLTQLPSVLVVPTSLGVNTVAEFVARLKSDKKGLAYG